MAERHDSTGVEYFSFHIQPSLCSVISETSRMVAQSKGFVHDEFEACGWKLAGRIKVILLHNFFYTYVKRLVSFKKNHITT